MQPIQAIHVGGSGQTIVLLHGYGADKQTWLGNAASLFDSGSVWLLELPGHGDAWQMLPAQSLSQMADQLRPALDELKDGPFHLVGHSLGGALLLLYAATQAQRVASLSLLAPVGLGSGVNRHFLHGLPLLSEPAETLALLRTTVNDAKLISPQIAPLLLDQLARNEFKQTLRICARAMQNTDPKLQPAIDSIINAAIPRQVIWGQEDKINPLAADDQQHFGGQWHTLAQCGHLPHIEYRTTVNQLLADFINFNTPSI